MQKGKKFILWFDEVNNKDVKYVGGKNASLGEMYQTLTKKGINIPYGFAITAHAYRYFIEEAGIKDQIEKIIKGLNIHSVRDLQKRGYKVRQAIFQAQMPKDLEAEIIQAYHKLSKKYGKENDDVAVRSSATAEDLPSASFAGQQETFLNIRGEKALLIAVRKCFASLFTDRAISYRQDKHFDHFKVFLSVAIQDMIRSDKSSSGVMFTIDTESGFRDAVLINSIYGLGEYIVQGRVTPDEFYVFKPTLKKGYDAIIKKTLGRKNEMLVYNPEGAKPVKRKFVPESEQKKFSITDKEVLQLAKWAVIIEDHYGRAMDIEWAKDAFENKLYIVQARPETVHSVKKPNVLEEYVLGKKGKVLVSGSSVGNKIGQGKVNVIKDVKQIHNFKKGEVLVTEMTDPDWEPIMKIAAAIVTNSGGRTCHAAIVSRELGIPCVVGTENATARLKSGRNVTVSCAEGEEGFIYEGLLKFKVNKTNIKNLKRPAAKIMMNIGSPDLAFSASFIPNDGVGLAREEFIINEAIKIHPLALIHYKDIKSIVVKNKIDELTQGYKDKTQFFIDKLAEGVGMIVAAFYPKDVIVRLSDFKSNEYANLIGGADYEPKEENPMIGWRGVSRYYDEKYRPAFELECKALKKVREEWGLKNLKIMVPFCRTIEEGQKVIGILEKNGLEKGKDGLEIYVMCEIPSNVLLADEFSKIFDGFSIGSNDLTQLTLGVDRDSALVAHVYDERNKAVKDFIASVIQKAKKNKRKIGICGQAPSDFPDFAKFLLDRGIDSISLNPDTVLKTTIELTQKKGKKNK